MQKFYRNVKSLFSQPDFMTVRFQIEFLNFSCYNSSTGLSENAFSDMFLLLIYKNKQKIYIIKKKEDYNSMWIADQWKDYEVIDCSKGEKLERWGQYTLIRPDPQVIWDTPKPSVDGGQCLYFSRFDVISKYDDTFVINWVDQSKDVIHLTQEPFYMKDGYPCARSETRKCYRNGVDMNVPGGDDIMIQKLLQMCEMAD